MPLLVVALAAGVALATASPARATSKRYTVIFDELVDGKPQNVSAAEQQLAKALAAQGVTLIDEDQARKIRSVTDAGTLLKGGPVPEVVTTLDADFIVVGECRLDPVGTDLYGGKAIRYSAEIQAKLVAVDTGQIVAVFTTRGASLGFNVTQAARKAARKAADDLAPDVLKAIRKLAQAARRIELTINGIPNISESERIVEGVKKLSVVKRMTVLRAARGVTKLEIQAKGKTPREIARVLDAADGLGVTVFGYSDRAIQAEYTPESAMRLTLVLSRLDNQGGAARDAWASGSLAGILGVELANLPFVDLARGTDTEAPAGKKQWAARVRKMGLDPVKTLVLTGSYRRTEGKAQVQLTVLSAASGATVLGGQGTCAWDELAECAAGLGRSVSQRVMPSLVAKRHLFRDVLPQVARAPANVEPARKPMKVGVVKVDNVFPARLSAYSKRPLGHVEVANRGDQPLTEVVVTTHLPGYMRSPLDTRVEPVPPGASMQLPVKVVLDRGALIHHDENEPVVLQVSIAYTLGELRVSQQRSQGILIYDRNTLSWSEPESVAAFVTPRTKAVQGVARQLANAHADVAKEAPFIRASALFAALGTLGVRYQRDPVNPYGAEALDYVQYPEQTLANKSGDCDDLAVLYAALSEALGMPVLLVTTPEHVFVAVYTGVPVHNGGVVALERERLLEHAGTLWVPLETTLLGKPVKVAWDHAIKELGRWRNQPRKLQVIDVRQAWGRFPPVSLVPPTTPSIVDAPKVGRVVGAEIAALKARRQQELQAALATAEAGLKKDPKNVEMLLRKGYLLALGGEMEAALAVFDAVDDDNRWGKHALNNVGNVHLVAGHGEVARKAYQGALALDGADGRIQLNAALSAFMVGDEAAFDEHVFLAMEAGQEEAVLRLARSGLGSGQGTRGADAGATAGRDLREAIRRAWEKKRGAKEVPQALRGKVGVRASDAGAGAARVTDHLFWL